MKYIHQKFLKLGIFAFFILLFLLIFGPYSPFYKWTYMGPIGKVLAQGGIELACPGGSRAIDSMSTRNPNTGNIRQNFCVDANGNIIQLITGLLAPSNIGNEFLACNTSSIYLYQTIASAYAASSSGMVKTCPGHNETLTANLILNKIGSTLKLSSPTKIIEGAFNIQVPSGTNNFAMICDGGQGTPSNGADNACSISGYTGTGNVIQIGDSSGDTFRPLIRGVYVDGQSGGTGSKLIKLIRTHGYVLDGVDGTF